MRHIGRKRCFKLSSRFRRLFLKSNFVLTKARQIRVSILARARTLLVRFRIQLFFRRRRRRNFNRHFDRNQSGVRQARRLQLRSRRSRRFHRDRRDTRLNRLSELTRQRACGSGGRQDKRIDSGIRRRQLGCRRTPSGRRTAARFRRSGMDSASGVSGLPKLKGVSNPRHGLLNELAIPVSNQNHLCVPQLRVRPSHSPVPCPDTAKAHLTEPAYLESPPRPQRPGRTHTHDGAVLTAQRTAGATRGSRTVKVVPSSAFEVTVSAPPCARTISRQI